MSVIVLLALQGEWAMARCVPEVPRFRSAAEEAVWRAARSRLRDVDVLVLGQRFTGRDGDWEVDLAILMPEGFVTVEVKGGHVWHADGTWWQRTADGGKALDLEAQAVSGKYLLARWLQQQPTWSFGRPRMGHLVALPDTRVGSGESSSGLPREWIVDAEQTRDIAGMAYDLVTGPLSQEPRHGPGTEAVQRAADLLGGRGDSQRETTGLVQVREEHVDRLTQDQYTVLDLARAVPRYRVTGGPGTGKTWLALEQARRWAAEGMRVGLVAYSRGLSTWVARTVATWPNRVRRQVWAGTYHALGVHWGAQVPDGADQGYWESTLPTQMLDLAHALPAGQRFDALVVDEAQDFADTWWPPLLAALKDPAAGQLAVFADDGQRVFGRTGGPDVDLVPLTLDENLRNSRPIAEAFAPLTGHRSRLLGGEGPAVRLISCSADDAVPTADDAAVGLLDDGWSARDVAVLTTWHRHPVHIEQVAAHGADGYWEQYWTGEDFFYATVPGFKGLERPAVVLAVDGFRDPALARDTLLVGMSRARDLLIVCADPDQLHQVAGDKVLGGLKQG